MSSPVRSGGRPHWGIFLGLAATIVVLDQLSKAWILANLSPGEVIEVIGEWVRLVFTQNAGALFGLFQDNAVLFGLISTGVIAAIVVFHGRSAPSRATSIALGLLLGGALGNLVDRFRLGYVVDFVDLGIPGVIRWYTFNVADAAISAAIVSLIVLAVWPGVGEWIDRLGTPAAPPDPGAPADPADHEPAGRPADG